MCRLVSASSASAASTSLYLSAILVLYRDRVLRVSLESVQGDYDEYRGMKAGSDEASREVSADGVSLEELLEQELLWDQAADT